MIGRKILRAMAEVYKGELNDQFEPVSYTHLTLPTTPYV